MRVNEIGFLTSHATIFQLYMRRHGCAGGVKKKKSHGQMDTDFGSYFDLGDLTLGQGHATPLGFRQQLCKVSSKCNLIINESHSLDINFSHVCTVTLTFVILPWLRWWHTFGSWTINVMYQQNLSYQWKVIRHTSFGYRWTVILILEIDFWSGLWHILRS